MKAPDPKYDDVLRLLERLRAAIRRQLAGIGFARLLSVIVGFFWFTLACDWGYFLIERADLPRPMRVGLFLCGWGVIGFTLVHGCLYRVFHRFRSRDLALLLERKFPQLESRLITAVELRSAAETQSGLASGMYQRTVDELHARLSNLPWHEVFDQRRLHRGGLIAALLLGSVGAFAWTNPGTFRLWCDRDLRLLNTQWPRQTAYQLWVVTPPNERLVKFREGTYLHPRGADLVLRLEVADGSEIPALVQIRYQPTRGGERQRAYLVRQGARQFQFSMTGVLESVEFRLWAGDAERRPFRVEVVDPPRLNQVELSALYPPHTHLNPVDPAGQPVRDLKPVQGTQVSLPAGTDFHLQAEANKPLERVHIQTPSYDLDLTSKRVSITQYKDQGGRVAGGTYDIPVESPWLSADGKRMHIPAVLDIPSKPRVLLNGTTVGLPLPFPPDVPLKIVLEDRDQIVSAEPILLTLRGIEDQPPRVATQLRGIGTSVTRKALIPIVGKIVDDYGVEKSGFEFRIDQQPKPQTRALLTPPRSEREFTLQRLPQEPFERFELLPLELSVGQKVTLAITAADGDSLTGPHQVTGEKYVFQIVSDEELLSQLHARELNLRLRFEQILSEVRQTRQGLEESRQSPPLATGTPAGGDDPLRSVVERSLLGVRKNHNESQSVEQVFIEIREELINNAVQTTSSLERIDQKLLKPLNTINTDDYNRIDEHLGELKVTSPDQKQRVAQVTELLGDFDRLISQMEGILKEMQRLETFGELVELLKSIKQEQEDHRRLTDQLRKQNAIKNLK